MAASFRSLRAALRGRPLPYVWVPEWHKTDHGLHLHFALGQYVHYLLIRSTWGHCNISNKRHSELPVGATPLHEARRAAGYLSEYISRSFNADETSRAMRLHRYDVAQGFQPPVVQFRDPSSGQVVDQAVERMEGLLPARSWMRRWSSSSLMIGSHTAGPTTTPRWARSPA